MDAIVYVWMGVLIMDFAAERAVEGERFIAGFAALVALFFLVNSIIETWKAWQ